MQTVKLKHGVFIVGKRIEYFYEGLLPVINGIIEIPLDKEHWIRRCWVSGYNRTPDDRILWDYTDVLKEIERQTAESGERDADEGADTGRQPETEHRVRKSKS